MYVCMYVCMCVCMSIMIPDPLITSEKLGAMYYPKIQIWNMMLAKLEISK